MAAAGPSGLQYWLPACRLEYSTVSSWPNRAAGCTDDRPTSQATGDPLMLVHVLRTHPSMRPARQRERGPGAGCLLLLLLPGYQLLLRWSMTMMMVIIALSACFAPAPVSVGSDACSSSLPLRSNSHTGSCGQGQWVGSRCMGELPPNTSWTAPARPTTSAATSSTIKTRQF